MQTSAVTEVQDGSSEYAYNFLTSLRGHNISSTHLKVEGLQLHIPVTNDHSSKSEPQTTVQDKNNKQELHFRI